ncbi:MAG: hypothetical protein CVU59_02585 [Deltaproteobacteria bacterium HGW-Deltaproteobacteria-17]|nr:MAG: hypothetical protein CVU59_02585 [Deltaproteobacteria bacterium HGW-Deltaproteobacteria-17]
MQLKRPGLIVLGSLILILSSCAGGREKPPCGNGLCDEGETWEMCNSDCPPPCGDGIAQDPEECDGTDLAGATCELIGLGPGTLECTGSCYLNTAGCSPCTDDCASGDPAACDGDTLVSCRQNNYTCWKWTRTDCAAGGQLCDEGTGTAMCADTCTDACLQDATRCIDEIVQTCGIGASGCLAFAATEDCADTGRLCDAGACVCAPGACTAGTTQCSGTIKQTCNDLGHGCGAWVDGEDCADTGWLCDLGTGTATCVPDCTSTCTGQGSTTCNGDVISTCTLQASGCLAPVDGEDCTATSRTCAGGACACVDECTESATQCASNTAQTCVVDAWGCRRWQDTTDCVSLGKICSGGACVCDDQCTDGQLQCSGTTPQSCVENGSGCWFWSSGAACAAPAQYCGAGACHGYTRSDFTGTYTVISGGTSLTSSTDDYTYSITLPFSFTYWGTATTSAHVSTNGWVSFGAAPGTTNYSNSTTLPSSGAPNQVIYGYWDDLVVDSSTCTGLSNLRWETQGTAPYRVVIIQWKEFCHINSSSHRGSFQIKLYETTNVFEILYNRSNWSGTSFSATIGHEDDSRGLAMLVNGSASGVPSTDYRFSPY